MDGYSSIRLSQPALFEIEKPVLRFVVRRHQATQLHWDLQIEANGILYSWLMEEPPSADPSQSVLAELAEPENPRYMFLERCIQKGKPGAGPTLVEDHGKTKPLDHRSSSQAWALHHDFLAGRVHLLMDGRIIKGAYAMERHGLEWQFRKLKDKHARTTPLNWTGVSPISGKTLEDLVREKSKRASRA